MPSHSQAQHRLMELAAHDPEARKRLGISREAADDYVNADKRSDTWKDRDHVAKKAAAMGMSPEIFSNLYPGNRRS